MHFLSIIDTAITHSMSNSLTSKLNLQCMYESTLKQILKTKLISSKKT